MAIQGARATKTTECTAFAPTRSNRCLWDDGRHDDCRRALTQRRISARIGSIAESATLAVDAKAKALKAAGRPVIGFGAGEPDFPTPDPIVEAAVDRGPRTRATTATPRPAACPSCAGDRREDARDSGYAGRAGPGAGHQRRQAGGLPGVRHAARPRRRGAAAGAVLDHLPGGHRLAGGVPVAVLADETQGYLVTVDQLEAARTDRTKVLLFCSPSQPDRRGLPAGAGRGDRPLGGRARHLGRHRRDLRAPGLRRRRRSPRCRSRCPSWPTTCVVLNGVAKTYAMTGWRVGWMIGPADVDHGRHQPAVARARPTSQRRPAGRARGGVRRPDRGRDDAARRSTGAARRSSRCCARSPGFECPEPQGAFYAYPSVKGALGREIGGQVASTSAELAELILDEAEVAVVPGEAFGTPGLPAALLRARRRRPRRRSRPDPAPARRERGAARRHDRIERRCRRRTCTCTSPARCGTRPSSSSPTEQGVALPDALTDGLAAGAVGRRRARLVPLPAALRRRPVASCGREDARATAGPRGGRGRRGRGLALAGDPGRPERLRLAVRRHHGRSPTWSSTRPATPARAPASRSRSSSPPTGPGTRSTPGRWPGLPCSTPAAGVVGFGLSNDERRGDAARRSRGVRARRAGPACCRRPTAASCSGPETSGPASTCSTPDGSATVCGPSRTRRCSTAWPTAASRLEVCPLSNVGLGVYPEPARCPCARSTTRASSSRSAPTTRCSSGRGWWRSTGSPGAARLHGRRAGGAGQDVGPRLHGPRRRTGSAPRRHRHLAGHACPSGWDPPPARIDMPVPCGFALPFRHSDCGPRGVRHKRAATQAPVSARC